MIATASESSLLQAIDPIVDLALDIPPSATRQCRSNGLRPLHDCNAWKASLRAWTPPHVVATASGRCMAALRLEIHSLGWSPAMSLEYLPTRQARIQSSLDTCSMTPRAWVILSASKETTVS